MTAIVRYITVDCTEPLALARFWHQVTGWSMDPDSKPGDTAEILIRPDGGQPSLLFVQVPEGKTVKNRLHLDVSPVDRTRDEEVARLAGLGATVLDDQRNPDGSGWVVMADPEGNEFCVERSAAERA